MMWETNLNERINKYDNLYLSPSASCISDGYIWSVRNKDNLLLKIDCLSGIITEAFRIDEMDSKDRKSWNDRLFIDNNKIFIFQDYSEDVVEYDIFKHTAKQLTVYPGNKKITLNPILVKNGKIYIFPYDEKEICIYDIKSNVWTQKSICKKNIRLRKKYAKFDGMFYFLIEDTNRIFKIDLQTLSNEVFELETNGYIPEDIGYMNDSIISMCIENNIVVATNVKNNAIVKILKYPENYRYIKKWAYASIYAYEDNMYLFPNDGNMILRINLEKNSVDNVFEEISFKKAFDDNGNIISQSFDEVIMCGEEVYGFSTFENTWRVFDLKKIESRKMMLFNESNERIIGEIKKVKFHNVIYESNSLLLENFMESLI